MACKEPVKERRPGPPNMEVARGAGSKTNFDVGTQTFFLSLKLQIYVLISIFLFPVTKRYDNESQIKVSSVLLTRRDMQNAFVHFNIYFRRNFDSIKVVSSYIIA